MLKFYKHTHYKSQLEIKHPLLRWWQVQQAIEAWKNILPCEEQAELLAEIEREENLRQTQAQTRALGSDAENDHEETAREGSSQSSDSSPSSDDEGPIVMEELNLEQAIAVSCHLHDRLCNSNRVCQSCVCVILLTSPLYQVPHSSYSALGIPASILQLKWITESQVDVNERKGFPRW